MDRPARRLIAAIFAALMLGALGGCEDQDLQKQLAQTQQDLATAQQGLQQCQADINGGVEANRVILEQLEHNTALAQACQWGIDICPASWEKSPAPNTSFNGQTYPVEPTAWELFGLIALKFSILMAAIASGTVVLILGLLKLIEPKAEALKEARRTIAEADARAERAEARAAHAKRQQEQIETEIAARKVAEHTRQTEIANSIKKAEKRLQRTQQDLAEAQAQLDTKKAANAALGAFQRKPKPDASTETDPEQDLDPLF